MKISVRTGIIALALTYASAAHAGVYKLMDLNADTLQAIDSKTIAKSDNIANVWLFTHYWRPQPFGTKSMTIVKSRIEIDCMSNKMRVAAINFFSDRNTPLTSKNDQNTEWTSIIPDAWFMRVRDATCDNIYGFMGKMDWPNYDVMVQINREVARQSYPAIP